MNAPFNRLPRFSPPAPFPSHFAPTMPMEALADPLDGTGADDWHDTQPQPGALEDAAVAARALALRPCENPAAVAAPATPVAPWPAGEAADSGFHEPMGGLHMRELESPELFEHLFGPGAGD